MDGMALPSNTFSLLVFSTMMGMLPLLLLFTTAYVKISVVFFIVRNAIGLQQTPANLILSTFAAVLALFISAPVVKAAYTELRSPTQSYQTISDWENAFTRASEPVRKFLLKHTGEVERTYFASAAGELWEKENMAPPKTDSLVVLVPSFMMHELTAAFKIGFMLYLPFLAIDLITANILMALGMMMLSPTIVGVAFKLLLFLSIDGWNLLVRGLILSYAG
jgi:type III secretion protein R